MSYRLGRTTIWSVALGLLVAGAGYAKCDKCGCEYGGDHSKMTAVKDSTTGEPDVRELPARNPDTGRAVTAETTLGGGRAPGDNPVRSDIQPAGSDLKTTPATATTVYLNGRQILKFRVGANGLTPQERWTMFMKKLQTIELPYVDASDVRIVTVNGAPTIRLAGKNLVTVTSADAQANGTNPRTLAGIWANNLRRAVGGLDYD